MGGDSGCPGKHSRTYTVASRLLRLFRPANTTDRKIRRVYAVSNTRSMTPLSHPKPQSICQLDCVLSHPMIIAPTTLYEYQRRMSHSPSTPTIKSLPTLSSNTILAHNTVGGGRGRHGKLILACFPTRSTVAVRLVFPTRCLNTS